MTIRFNALLLGAILFCCTIETRAQGFSVIIDSVQATPDQTICIPVRALGFNSILEFQYVLSWGSPVLTFDHTQNYHLPGWSSMDFSLAPPNHLFVTWSDPSGLSVTRVDGAILYEICFKVVGPLGSHSNVFVADDYYPPGTGGAEAYTPDGVNVWNSAGNVPGYVSVVPALGYSDPAVNPKINFLLFPNPTNSAAVVDISLSSPEKTVLLISDMLGRMVYEETWSLEAGKNEVEIPAKALTAKGLYQVSLKTGQGVVSQVLTVQ